MVTVFRATGLRVVVFVDDHASAHVHVFGDGDAKINLIDTDARRYAAPCASRSTSRFCCWNGGTTFMAELTDARIDAATERGRIALQQEPRAASASYDSKLGRMIIELTNGCTFAFPPRLAQGLERATEGQLAEVEILGAGTGLHWEALDAELSIPGLLAGLFGTRAYMARNVGRTKSLAKAAASRSNGTKGGRPRTAGIA